METEMSYVTAVDLDHAWPNFELDLPLEAYPDGKPNPFYVNRPGNPTARLERELLRPYHEPPKYFFSGHTGCGKSTELRRLAANPRIQEKFWPVHFSIRDQADITDLDFRDVLLAIGGQIFRDYRKKAGNCQLNCSKSWRPGAGRYSKKSKLCWQDGLTNTRLKGAWKPSLPRPG